MIASAYESLVLRNDVPGQPESQSSADVALGCEEGLKYLGVDSRRDAISVVNYRNPYTGH